MSTNARILIYLFRRDLRVSDNPILHHLASTADHGFTHLLPVFVFPSHQIELSGFLKEGGQSPYPKPLSHVGKFWRCGPHRAKFIADSVWDLKSSLESLNSGLVMRVGNTADVVKGLIGHFDEKDVKVGAVWMTEEKSTEEIQEQDAVAAICGQHEVDFKLWTDEKYFVDDRDTGLEKPQDLPDVFTTYRKSQEPLRERPRPTLPRPENGALPPMPDTSLVAPQDEPFIISETLEDLQARLVKPVSTYLVDPPTFPDDIESAHPSRGGETEAQKRVSYLIKSGAMSRYKDTRNGLVGLDYSTKLSAYLALGCLTSRYIHTEMVKLEDGTEPAFEGAEGYGKGENKGTTAVRFELLWRDYMRLCTMKFGPNLFKLEGFRQEDNYSKVWKTADAKKASPKQEPSTEDIAKILQRFFNGTTGLGLIDASQRELFLTGYTSNRARQNVASFFAKHLEIDWRYGAEWYEFLLVDYDVSSNWANWQYVSGVGNDPRGSSRVFNPVKQAFDYDTDGTYVRGWVPELRKLEKLENVFQVCTTPDDELVSLGLVNNIMAADPVKRIPFTVDPKPRTNRRPYQRRRGGNARGGRGGGGGGDTNGHNHSSSSTGRSNSNGNNSSDSVNGGFSSPNESPPEGPKGQNGTHHRGSAGEGRRQYNSQGYGWGPRNGGNGQNRGNNRGRGYGQNSNGRGYNNRRANAPAHGGYQPVYVPTPVYMHNHPFYPPPPPGVGHGIGPGY
ncbi:hypothetical protein S40293_01444 [Stachybotrys chartarum IBT 40293]|nr:hypothetical protein S40293_01444 [Stachybotrys chartarum IBT 40293]